MIMRNVRRILVAVKYPGAAALPGVVKAAQLAQALSAELILFHVIHAPICLGTDSACMPDRQGDLDGRVRDGAEESLRQVAQLLRGRGLVVSISVRAGYPADEAILREAERMEADWIVAEAHPRGHHAASLLHLTDWELLRRSPVPVLLVKSPAPYQRPKVLVALDPDHCFGKPPALDAEILAVGSAVCAALGGELHAVHAYAPIPPSVAAKGVSSAQAVAQVQRQTEAWAAQKLAHAVRAADIATANQHVVGRHVPDAIEQVAAECDSAIVVLGAVARTGLKRALIGNTAERVLDRLAGDILLVKPSQPAERPRDLRLTARVVEGAVIPGA
jgi:universal stress protein E